MMIGIYMDLYNQKHNKIRIFQLDIPIQIYLDGHTVHTFFALII